MDPYNTADNIANTRARDLTNEYDANRELKRARVIGRPLRSATTHRGLGLIGRGVVGVILWGVILVAVTGATAVLMGY